ncbi:MAG: undecaprenyl-phosphate glucose phosphotransferase [Hyphomicrobiaceae bacterium]
MTISTPSTERPNAFDKTLESFIARPRRDHATRRLSPLLVTTIAMAGEFLVTTIAGFLTAMAWVETPGIFTETHYHVAILSTSLLGLVCAQRLELFTTPALRSPVRRLWRISAAWGSAISILLVALFLLKVGPDFSRGWLILWYGSGLAVILCWRWCVYTAVRHYSDLGLLNRRAVVYGAGQEGLDLIDRIQTDPDCDVAVLGVFDERGTERSAELGKMPLLGNVEQLVSYCRSHSIDMLILSLPITAERRLLTLLKQLWVLPIDIRLAAHANSLRFRPRAYSHIGSVALLDLFDRPLTEWDSLVKVVFDKTLALIALILFAPLMALTALAVRLESRGPVFFRQKRLGFNNELIDVWKFRSMYVDMADNNASRLVTRGDPRVTKVGRFIRRTSIDELPQLFNVLSGTLSLVGPRPHALQAKAADRLYHEVVDGYFARHKVKPGITGLAQIRGWRGETNTEEKIRGRVASDLEYIENWSLLLDLYILAATPLSLVSSKNAY